MSDKIPASYNNPVLKYRTTTRKMQKMKQGHSSKTIFTSYYYACEMNTNTQFNSLTCSESEAYSPCPEFKTALKRHGLTVFSYQIKMNMCV